MLAQTERGCLVIADISGYTGYLAGSELDHAQDVLADLMETVVNGLRPVLRLAKLEGDAAFAYAPAPKVDGSMLLDLVEGCYFGFRRRLRNIQQATTCPCNACVLIPKLNLKFFVHHGEFVRHRIAGHEELTGTDVILVHRLLKNTVTATLGLEGYALFTMACLDAMGVDPTGMGMHVHGESYESLGGVSAYIHNLEARWEHEREARRLVVSPEHAEVDAAATLPAPPPVVWEFLTDPAKRVRFQAGADRIDQTSPSGRRGVGTTNHCVHGPAAIIEEILDWRPFHYFTIRANVPGLGMVTYMFDLTPVDGGTLLRFRLDKIKNRKQREQWEAIRAAFLASSRQTMQGLTAQLVEDMKKREPEVALPDVPTP